MSNWGSCIREDCLSFAYYSSDGKVHDNCTGAMQMTPDNYDAIAPETKLFDLSCDEIQTSVVGAGPDQFRIDDKFFGVPASMGKVAAMKVELGHVTWLAGQEATGNTPLIVRVEFDSPLQKKGSAAGDDTVRSKIERFENARAYEEWKSSLGETKVNGSLCYLNSVDVSDTAMVIKFKGRELLQTAVNGPEVFIVNPNDANGIAAFNVIEGRERFKEYLARYAGDKNAGIQVLHLTNGSAPQLLNGRSVELAIFADMLVEETKGKSFSISRGPKTPPEWDIGVRISAPQGLRNDHNYIKESVAFNEWASEFKTGFQNNMTNERGRYYAPATGFSISGHRLFNPYDWLQIGLGIEDELAWRTGSIETANSELFSNTISTSIPARIGVPELVYLALKPADFGWMSASGETTLKDQSIKHDTSIDAFVWQPGVGIGAVLYRKFALEAGYKYRQFFNSSIPLQAEHVAQFGVIFYFGGSEGKGVAEEQASTPVPIPAKNTHYVDTAISEQKVEEVVVAGAPKFTPVELEVTPWETASETETFDVDSNQLKMLVLSDMRIKYTEIALRPGETSRGRRVNPGVYRIVNKIEDYVNFLKGIGMREPKVRISISAHADSSGTKEHNAILSEERGENFINADQSGAAGYGLLHELGVRGLSGIMDAAPGSEVLGEERPIGYQCETPKKCSVGDIGRTKLAVFEICDRSGKTKKCEEMNLYSPCFDKDKNAVKDPRVASKEKKYSLEAVENGGYCQVNLGRTKTSYLENFQASRRVDINMVALTLPAYKGVAPSLPAFAEMQVQGLSLYRIPLTGAISTDIPPINNADITNLVGMVKKFAVGDGNEVTVTISLPGFVGANNYVQKWIGAAVAENTHLPVKVVFSTDPELGKKGIILTVGPKDSADHNNEELRRVWSNLFKI